MKTKLAYVSALFVLSLNACFVGSNPGAQSANEKSALSPVAQAQQLNPISKGDRLNPISKGERLNPVSKGERILSGTLTGQIVYAEKNSLTPAPAAEVFIPGTLLSAQTNQQGYFTLSGIPQNSAFTLLAERVNTQGQILRALLQSPTQAFATQMDSATEALHFDLGQIVLQETAAFSALLKDAQGQALAETQLQLEGTPFSVRSDASGYVALAHLPAGQYTLSATEVELESPEIVLQANEKKEIAPLQAQAVPSVEDSVAIQGVLLSASQPVAGATVTLVGQDLRHLRSTVSQADGCFTLTQIPALTEPDTFYELYVTRPFAEAMRVEISASDHLEALEIQVPVSEFKAHPLQLQVQNCQGQPEPRVLIQVNPPQSFQPVIFTDNRGLAKISGLLPGYYTLYAVKGQARDFQGVVITPQDTSTQELLFRVNPAQGQSCDAQ